jgi:hypothetical protein
MPAGPRRNIVLSLLAALGVGSRLPAAPFFGVLWLLTWWPGRRPTLAEGTASVAGLALATALVALPFWLAAPEMLKFWILDFHRASVPRRSWGLSPAEIAVMAPALWLLATGAIVMVLARHRPVTRETGVLLAALAALAANLLLHGVYDEYCVPFLLPLAVAAAALVYDGCTKWNLLQLSLGALLLIMTQVLTGPLVLGPHRRADRPAASWWLPGETGPYNLTLPADLAAARAVVERFLPKDAPLIGPNIILAAETGRAVPPELRMGPFSFTAEMSDEQATRLHLVTMDQLHQWYTRPEVTVIAFYRRRVLDYGWSMPSFTEMPIEVQAQVFAPLRENFTVEEYGGFLILLRNRPAPAR